MYRFISFVQSPRALANRKLTLFFFCHKKDKKKNENNRLLWRKTFKEDSLQWKVTFYGGEILMEGKGKLRVNFVSPATTRTRATFLAKNIKHTEEP